MDEAERRAIAETEAAELATLNEGAAAPEASEGASAQ
jgi:DNA-directed RNA polymerase subunit beta'